MYFLFTIVLYKGIATFENYQYLKQQVLLFRTGNTIRFVYLKNLLHRNNQITMQQKKTKEGAKYSSFSFLSNTYLRTFSFIVPNIFTSELERRSLAI
jgi:hypothetical protein